MRLTITRHVSLAILATTLLLILVFDVSTRSILLRSYENLETQDTRQNVGRAYDALAAELSYLSSKAADWAQWDDAYDFVVTRDPAFIKSNMTTSTLRDMQISLMLYVNTNGEIVYSIGYDPETDTLLPAPAEWTERLATTEALLWQTSAAKKVYEGLLMTAAGPLLVVVNPILTSEGVGPSRGVLIMGRYLDDALIAELARTTHLRLTLQRLDASALPGDIPPALPESAGVILSAERGVLTAQDAPIAVRVLSDWEVAGYLAVRDLHGVARLILRVALPRDIVGQGRATMGYLVTSLLLGMLVFTGVVLYLVRFLVLQPIKQLKAGVQRIGEGDLAHRIKAAGQDEISQVAAAFNEMAGRLHDRDAQLAAKTAALSVEVAQRRQAEAELRDLNNTLEARVTERTAELAAEVAERMHAQTELQLYANRLERSNRELQEFTYVASHDLQEPLRKVQAFGTRLQEKYGDALGDQGRDYLTRMQNAAARMQTLIEGLLSYTRITSKAQPFEPVRLGQIANEVTNDLEIRIAQSGGCVQVGDLPTVRADPLQMRQLLQNLIANALKFHRPDTPPVVHISTAAVNGAWCQIQVADNGIGFEDKYAERIFQVFQRLNGRDVYEGAGIGLAICRKIVERHGGVISAHGTLGQGASFVFTLPLAQPAGA